VPIPQELSALADAASADGLIVLRFAQGAEQFCRGNHSGTAAFKTNLVSWRNNHDQFAAGARGNPQPEAVLPKAARAPSADWRWCGKELLNGQAAAERLQKALSGCSLRNSRHPTF
jgi:hypothetical protein